MQIDTLLHDVLKKLSKNKKDNIFRYDPKIDMYAFISNEKHTIKLNIGNTEQISTKGIIKDIADIKITNGTLLIIRYWNQDFIFEGTESETAKKIHSLGVKLVKHWKEKIDKENEKKVVESLNEFKDLIK